MGNVGELQGGGVTLKVGSLIFGDYVIVNEVADDSLVQNGLGALLGVGRIDMGRKLY